MWKCEFTGQPARGPIKVDGSDRCFCSGCQSAILVARATGAADAMQSTLGDVLSYIGSWNDPKEARRLLKLARNSAGEMSHILRQAVGDRLDELYVPDPDWKEDDEYNEKWLAAQSPKPQSDFQFTQEISDQLIKATSPNDEQ